MRIWSSSSEIRKFNWVLGGIMSSFMLDLLYHDKWSPMDVPGVLSDVTVTKIEQMARIMFGREKGCFSVL